MTTMRNKLIRHHKCYFSIMKLLTTITDNKIEYRIGHQVVHLGKAINKMTVKKKEWEWVWEIDKEVVMMLKMRVEVWMQQHRTVVKSIRSSILNLVNNKMNQTRQTTKMIVKNHSNMFILSKSRTIKKVNSILLEKKEVAVVMEMMI